MEVDECESEAETEVDPAAEPPAGDDDVHSEGEPPALLPPPAAPAAGPASNAASEKSEGGLAKCASVLACARCFAGWSCKGRADASALGKAKAAFGEPWCKSSAIMKTEETGDEASASATAAAIDRRRQAEPVE